MSSVKVFFKNLINEYKQRRQQNRNRLAQLSAPLQMTSRSMARLQEDSDSNDHIVITVLDEDTANQLIFEKVTDSILPTETCAVLFEPNTDYAFFKSRLRPHLLPCYNRYTAQGRKRSVNELRQAREAQNALFRFQQYMQEVEMPKYERRFIKKVLRKRSARKAARLDRERLELQDQYYQEPELNIIESNPVDIDSNQPSSDEIKVDSFPLQRFLPIYGKAETALSGQWFFLLCFKFLFFLLIV